MFVVAMNLCLYSSSNQFSNNKGETSLIASKCFVFRVTKIILLETAIEAICVFWKSRRW